jgi:hypothetical protein
MATNATIASQIQRIKASRDILRNVGIKFSLYVPEGTYWDDTTDKDITTTSAALLKSTDQIDKIAAAFNSIKYVPDSEIEVPILLKKNGTTVVSTTKNLAPGFYAGAVIKPYITVEEDKDFVIDVQTIVNRSLETQTGTITPSAGYNYIDSLSYKIVDGAIEPDAESFDSTGAVAKVKTSGWLDAGDTQKIKITTSELKSKVGTNAQTTINSGATIVPSPLADTVITVTKGIHGSDRTLTVKSVASQTNASAVAADILNGKTAWVNGQLVTGNMPNYGGTSTGDVNTPMVSLSNIGGNLAIQPALGYYNDYSNITTGIKYNPTRVFNTTSITVGGTDTMASQTYYETIPAGYYHTAITRKVTVQDAAGSMSIDYSAHKAKLTITRSGWIDQGDVVDVAISAGAAEFKLTDADLNANAVVLEPSRDTDGSVTTYLTKVTVDNTVIYNKLSAI